MRLHTPKNLQQGAALIVGLVFLLMLTMLGITAIQTSSFEERMAGNKREQGIALLAAETALSVGQAQVESETEQTAASTGYYDSYHGTPAPAPEVEANWTVANARQVTSVTFTDMALSSQPMLWIDWIDQTNFAVNDLSTGGGPGIKKVNNLTVTTRSTGGAGQSNTVLQISYRRPAP